MRKNTTNKIAKYKIYLIGNKNDPFSIVTRSRFERHQKILETFGYDVVNPLETYDNIKLKSAFDCNRYNIKKLMECNAVYLMSDVSTEKGSNLELKISIDLGLMIIQDFYYDFETKFKIYESDLQIILKN